MKPPVIVVPGITATSLKDFYPTKAETVWEALNRDYRRVALHPDDLRLEQTQPAMVRADLPFEVPYGEYVRELRHDLSPSQDRPRPVFLFPYDWRKPLRVLVGELADFVEEVVARTALLRHYLRGQSRYSREGGLVDMVGHSMGGLLVAGYLAREAAARRVRKVVTLGTPFGGSFEAVLRIVTGTAELEGGAPSSREREVARLTPSLYHLIPEQGVRVAPGPSRLPTSLFHVDLWQKGVLQSIAEHLRTAGLDADATREGRLRKARLLLQGILDEARLFREEVGRLRLEEVGMTPNDWLAVVGVGERTRVALEIQDRGPREGPLFVLSSRHRKNGYPMPVVEGGAVLEDLEETGDGTVCYRAAVPPFLDPCCLVCVSPDDFGYWEVRDRFLGRHVANLHGLLPAMNRVIKLSAAFLMGDAGRPAPAHAGLRGRRSPGCWKSGGKWSPPFHGLAEKVPPAVAGGGWG